MRFAVDKIIDSIVVLENISTGEIKEIDIDNLPKNIHEGSILNFVNGKYETNVNEEKSRKENLRERIERLKKLKK